MPYKALPPHPSAPPPFPPSPHLLGRLLLFLHSICSSYAGLPSLPGKCHTHTHVRPFPVLTHCYAEVHVVASLPPAGPGSWTIFTEAVARHGSTTAPFTACLLTAPLIFSSPTQFSKFLNSVPPFCLPPASRVCFQKHRDLGVRFLTEVS